MTARTGEFRATIWQMTLMGLRYLGGRKLRTALTTLAIVFGVSLIFSMNLVLPSVLDAFQRSMTTLVGSDISVSSVSGESFVPGPVLERIAAVDQVKAVTGVLHRQFAVPTLGESELGSTTQIDLIGIDPATIGDVRQFAVSEGRMLQPGDAGKAVFPASIAEFAPQLSVDTTFPLITAGGLKVFTVVGLMAEPGTPSAVQMYVTLADAQAAFGQPGLINTVEIAIEPGADREAVSAAIQQALGDGYSLNASTNISNTWAAAQIGFAMFDLLGVLALFLGAFLIFNTFRTVVIERRHDLAMLRAVGATQRQITLMIVIESLVQGAVGTLVGIVIGFLFASGMTAAVNRFMGQYLNIGDLYLRINAFAVILSVALGMATALLAGYIPARSAGKTSPLNALRPATVASVQRAARWSLIGGGILMALAVVLLLTGSRGAIGGAVLFLIGMVIAAPGLVIPAARLFSPLLSLWFDREGDLARGNLVRQPGRAAITGSTLMIGLATFIVIAACVISFGDLIRTLADANFASDLILLPQSLLVYNNVVGADETMAARISALPEVESVASLRYASGSSNGQSLQVLGINPEAYAKVASFEFSQGDAVTAFAELESGRNAVVTTLALSTLRLNLGDEFVLQTSVGPQTYRIEGVASDLLTFKVASVFVSQANLAADFHKNEDVMVMVDLKPDADEDAALADVQTILNDYPQFSAHLTGDYKEELIQLTGGALGLFYLVGLVILIPAALGLLNTLTINILERTREIGVVRAVGGSRTQVRRVVTAEALLLGIFGAAMGVLAGVAMSYGFISAFATVGWKMPYALPVMGMIAALVIGVLLGLFASILPARNAAKLDIIRALQYE